MLSLFFSCMLAVFIYMSSWFALALIKKDNGIVDVAWGIGFILISLTSLNFMNFEVSHKAFLVNLLILTWALRLSTYIFIRNKVKGKEDFRYANWRRDWGKNWVLRSFLQVFMLQGFIMLLVALPIMMVNYYSDASFILLDFVAVFLFGIGFYWEALSDYQLFKFKQDKNNKGKIMRYGLWKYSRHPNYFGEFVMWWGFFLFVATLPLVYISIISPVLISYLLIKVSGVPMLEKKYLENEEYQEYKRKTSSFFPTFVN